MVTDYERILGEVCGPHAVNTTGITKCSSIMLERSPDGESVVAFWGYHQSMLFVWSSSPVSIVKDLSNVASQKFPEAGDAAHIESVLSQERGAGEHSDITHARMTSLLTSLSAPWRENVARAASVAAASGSHQSVRLASEQAIEAFVSIPRCGTGTVTARKTAAKLFFARHYVEAADLHSVRVNSSSRFGAAQPPQPLKFLDHFEKLLRREDVFLSADARSFLASTVASGGYSLAAPEAAPDCSIQRRAGRESAGIEIDGAVEASCGYAFACVIAAGAVFAPRALAKPNLQQASTSGFLRHRNLRHLFHVASARIPSAPLRREARPYAGKYRPVCP